MNGRKCGNKFASNSDKGGVDLKRLSAEVLKMFSDMQRERLDLHVMFESSGNEPAARAQVLDAVDDLVREGFLQSAGGDFYILTEKGKQALAGRDWEKPSAR
jgi:DNA-binding PadR family transcriptional regulator